MLLISACSGPHVPTAVEIKIEKIDATEEWRPTYIEVAVGGTVTWNNTSLVWVHSITSGEGLFDTKLGGGESFHYTFNQTGTFTYYDDPQHTAGTVGMIFVK